MRRPVVAYRPGPAIHFRIKKTHLVPRPVLDGRWLRGIACVRKCRGRSSIVQRPQQSSPCTHHCLVARRHRRHAVARATDKRRLSGASVGIAAPMSNSSGRARRGVAGRNAAGVTWNVGDAVDTTAIQCSAPYLPGSPYCTNASERVILDGSTCSRAHRGRDPPNVGSRSVKRSGREATVAPAGICLVGPGETSL
jgi:hypothetical protein